MADYDSTKKLANWNIPSKGNDAKAFWENLPKKIKENQVTNAQNYLDPKGTTGGGLKIKFVKTRATFSAYRHYYQALLLLTSLANAVSSTKFIRKSILIFNLHALDNVLYCSILNNYSYRG